MFFFTSYTFRHYTDIVYKHTYRQTSDTHNTHTHTHTHTHIYIYIYNVFMYDKWMDGWMDRQTDR